MLPSRWGLFRDQPKSSSVSRVGLISNSSGLSKGHVEGMLSVIVPDIVNSQTEFLLLSFADIYHSICSNNEKSGISNTLIDDKGSCSEGLSTLDILNNNFNSHGSQFIFYLDCDVIQGLVTFTFHSSCVTGRYAASTRGACTSYYTLCAFGALMPTPLSGSLSSCMDIRQISWNQSEVNFRVMMLTLYVLVGSAVSVNFEQITLPIIPA